MKDILTCLLIGLVTAASATAHEVSDQSLDYVPRMCWVTHIEPARCVHHPGYHFAGPWYDMGDEWHRVWYWQPPWTEHIPARTVRRLQPCHNLHILEHTPPASEPIEDHPGRLRKRAKGLK